jgi:glycosidase
MIYYGDEAGMWGGNDPCCRKPMVWPDLTYEPEAVQPDGAPRSAPDEVAFDHDLHAYYRKIIALRKASPALRHGDYRTLLADDARRLFAFARQAEGDTAVCLFNADEVMHTVELPVDDGEWQDALDDAPVVLVDGVIQITIPPLSGVVYRRAAH